MYKNCCSETLSTSATQLGQSITKRVARAQRRLRPACAFAQSDQNLLCSPEDTLDPCLPIEYRVKTLIRVFAASTCSLVGNDVLRFIYSRLSLSRIPRDSLKYFEISVARHIRFAELRKK